MLYICIFIAVSVRIYRIDGAILYLSSDEGTGLEIRWWLVQSLLPPTCKCWAAKYAHLNMLIAYVRIFYT